MLSYSLMIIVGLIALGLCFGSFVNALVFRLHWQSEKGAKSKEQRTKYSVLEGRSMCPNCKHTLTWYDLVPVVSWALLQGKCRYCQKPISWQYPIVELSVAALFIISYIFWPAPLQGWEVAQSVLWLVCLVGFVALIVYDLRWMLLPNKIIFPLYGVAFLFIVAKIVQTPDLGSLLTTIWGIAVGGGIFYLLFQLSDGRWIGGGDVKLGFLLGALVGGPMIALLMLFIASALGSIVSAPLLVSRKISRHARIPFGPFLIAGAIITELFGQRLIDWYINLFIY